MQMTPERRMCSGVEFLAPFFFYNTLKKAGCVKKKIYLEFEILDLRFFDFFQLPTSYFKILLHFLLTTR